MNKYNCYIITLISLFFVFLIGYFLSWPILMYDTDLWYHLSGGRYFWQNMAISNDAHFSYVVPPKTWYNYYWMFQAIVYKIHEWTDYYGLIVLRCFLYFMTSLLICLSLVRLKDNRTTILLSTFSFIACSLVILTRELAVRPHLFSYLFIAVFLYILEFRRDRIWILPILGILWSNIHGIEYPVMFLIAFAYLAEMYWHQSRNKSLGSAESRKNKWFLISVFYTIFITPGMTELVQIPFSVTYQSAAYQHLYVMELIPIPFVNYFVFAPITIHGVISAFLNIVVLFTMVTVLICLWKRKLRISHAILFVGAVFLLSKHTRFSCEFALLSIPIMNQGIRGMTKEDLIPNRIIDLVLPVIVVILPFLVFHGLMNNRPAYPFSSSNLPTGNVKFLNQNAPGGKILNEHNTGGFLPWALHDKFSIFMDMQMSLFSDTDFAESRLSFHDRHAFKRFIEKYEPSFISVSFHNKAFKNIVATDLRFVPVFFDHAEVLYVNKVRYADLANKYTLKAIDPFNYGDVIYAEEKAEEIENIFIEASRIHAQDPANFRANHILSSIAVARRQYGPAMKHAEVLIRSYPEQSLGYALKGDVYFGRKQYDEAASYYKRALDMGRTKKAEKTYWNLHASYFNLKEYRKAYKVLSKYVNPFSSDADYKEIYQLAVSASTVGKTREAKTFLTIAQMKVPANDVETENKIRENLSTLTSMEKN